MSTYNIDYRAVLADLKEKRDALDKAIDGIERVLLYYDSASPAPTFASQESFIGLSIGDAVKKHLNNVKRKQSIREIVEALETGGYPHTSANFTATVRTALSREITKGDIVKLPDGDYGLSPWYPGLRSKESRIKAQEGENGQQEHVTTIEADSEQQ